MVEPGSYICTGNKKKWLFGYDFHFQFCEIISHVRHIFIIYFQRNIIPSSQIDIIRDWLKKLRKTPDNIMWGGQIDAMIAAPNKLR